MVDISLFYSLIDVCMNNSAEEIREYLGDFRLI